MHIQIIENQILLKKMDIVVWIWTLLDSQWFTRSGMYWRNGTGYGIFESTLDESSSLRNADSEGEKALRLPELGCLEDDCGLWPL
jgi:hypothetical protein